MSAGTYGANLRASAEGQRVNRRGAEDAELLMLSSVPSAPLRFKFLGSVGGPDRSLR